MPDKNIHKLIVAFEIPRDFEWMSRTILPSKILFKLNNIVSHIFFFFTDFDIFRIFYLYDIVKLGLSVYHYSKYLKTTIDLVVQFQIIVQNRHVVYL